MGRNEIFITYFSTLDNIVYRLAGRLTRRSISLLRSLSVVSFGLDRKLIHMFMADLTSLSGNCLAIGDSRSRIFFYFSAMSLSVFIYLLYTKGAIPFSVKFWQCSRGSIRFIHVFNKLSKFCSLKMINGTAVNRLSLRKSWYSILPVKVDQI